MQDQSGSKLINRQLPQPPSTIGEPLFTFLRQLVGAVASFINDVSLLQNSGKQSVLQVDVLTDAPLSPVNGMLAYADGTNWNPGSGAGFYGYQSGAWVKL